MLNKLRTAILEYLGINKLCEEAVKTRVALSRLADEDTRLRALIAGKFDDLKPASNEFIGVMAQQIEGKIDLVFVSLDGLAAKLGKPAVSPTKKKK